MGGPKSEPSRLADNHGWRAAPGHKILVLGRGAVRLEIPERWFVEVDEDCVKARDREPPDDECVLGVSHHLWPAAGNAPSVGRLVRTALDGDERSFAALHPITEETRIDIALGLGSGKVRGCASRPRGLRAALHRAQGRVQALLTFDFWLSDLEQCDARWHGFLSSLQLGQWVADPTRGPVFS
jgi:hypothetical protein